MNWKAMATALAAFAGALGSLWLLYDRLGRDPRAVPTPMIGNTAPEFALQTLSGDTLRRSNAADMPLVVNFWASWCIPCQYEHPLLVALDEKYEGRVRVVGIVYQDTRANALRWIHERGGTWTNVLDPRSRTAIEYGVRGVPETFFITRDGRILHHLVGPVTPEALETWVPRLLTTDSTARAPKT